MHKKETSQWGLDEMEKMLKESMKNLSNSL